MNGNFYSALLSTIAAPCPTTGEREFVVEGVPDEWPHECGVCYLVAVYTARLALEQNCAYVEVRRGLHKHRFDLGDLIAAVKAKAGGLYRPNEAGGNWKTAELLSYGGELGTLRNYVHVPVAVCSDPASPTKEL